MLSVACDRCRSLTRRKSTRVSCATTIVPVGDRLPKDKFKHLDFVLCGKCLEERQKNFRTFTEELLRQYRKQHGLGLFLDKASRVTVKRVAGQYVVPVPKDLLVKDYHTDDRDAAERMVDALYGEYAIVKWPD